MPTDAAKDAVIALQAQLLVVQAARNAELEARVADLEERLARLERAVSRNSGNSSVPPSADDLPGRMPPQRRGREGNNRRQGKQPGAPGAHLAWSQNPGQIVPLFPRGACTCGRNLAGAADLGAASHQVVDGPLVTATVTQYDEHAVACACGRVQAAPPPAQSGAPGTVTYRLNIQAWCVFLLAAHHVPVARCAEIIASLSGTRPSDGFVHAMLARAAQAVAAANMRIRALIITASVICADRDPHPCRARAEDPQEVPAGRLHQPAHLLLPGQPVHAELRRVRVPDLPGVIVHDRCQNYDKTPGVIHQLCCSHLLRDLEDAAQSYPDAIWPGQAASGCAARPDPRREYSPRPGPSRRPR